jgi:hypothetical protein
MKKILFLATILFSLQASAQSFTVTGNKKNLGTGNVENGTIVKLPSLKKLTAKTLVFDFKNMEEAVNVSIMAMDDNRQEIGERITVENFKGGKINVALGTAIRSSKVGVSFYILKIPADPNVAATVRVAPIKIATFK